MNFKLFFISICLLISYSAIGQFNNLKFENLDMFNGLSSSTCVEILQDKEGFLWFGTIDGLNKYNGYEFEIYRSVLNDSTSISNNRVNAIEEDNAGNLWIGTNNGLNFFNKQTNKFSRINLYKNLSLSNSSQKIINDLLYDTVKNTLWVATNNGAIKIVLHDESVSSEDYKFSCYLNDQSNSNSLDNNGVNVILKDKNNTIWVSTNGNHLNHYNEDKDNFERILIRNREPYELNHVPKSILIDADGDFWIGNDLSNFLMWDTSSNSFNHISLVGNKHIPIHNFYQDEDGLVWISTDGNGLYLYSKEKNTIQQHIVNNISDSSSLPNNKPTKIFQDIKGIYWIGSYDKGVSKMDPSNYSFGHYYYQPDNPIGMNEKTVQAVLQDHKERIWISTYNGGLNLFNEKKKSFSHFGHKSNSNNTLSSKKILYTFESKDGNIWICTLDGGLNKFNPETNKFKSFLHNPNDSLSIAQNSVWAGVEDSKNRLWLGLRTEGLSLLDPKTNHFYNYKNNYSKDSSLVSNNVICVFIDHNNRLFIGTSLGLNMVDLNTLDGHIPKQIEFIDVKIDGIDGIDGNGINYVTEDHLGNIWVGTDSGIYKLDTDLNYLKSYSSQNGLPNNLVVGIKEDNNYNFWITTKGGLSLLNPDTHQIKNFNVHDGLQGAEYQSKSIEKTKDGRIIIGGINGFNIFQPEQIIVSDTISLTPIITNFKLNNKLVVAGDIVNKRVLLNNAISETKDLTLKYNENYISFEFVALNFENPEQVQYAYRMGGLDDEFINIGSNRVVNHSNLQPGRYTFELKASADGQWDKVKSVIVNIEILPPLWRTWWAYILYAIIGLLLLYVVVHYYTLKIQEAQQHELDQMKLQFFINVSHEFRTPLTLILNPADKILSNFNNDIETVKTSAQSIQRSARRLLHLVNQLLDYRKMDAGMAPLQLEKADFIKFSEDIFTLFKELAVKKQLGYTFNATTKNISSFFDFDKVEKIITNLISNAIKYTNSGGEVKVTISKTSMEKRKSKLFFFVDKKLNDYVEIIVEDTGIGLNSEQLKNIFSRFYNLDTTKTGVGIGLNFTKALVEKHGGEIFVKSKPNLGSKFVVRLPLIKKAKTEVIEPIKNEYLINSMNSVEYEMHTSNNDIEIKIENSSNIENNNNDKRPTLLLVEDNKELRIHLKSELISNYIVKEAVNGAEGLKMVSKHYPDIIISDVIMPEMDGFEMCQKIKTEFETCHIPVLLLTARTLEADQIEGFNSGADGYLSKPFSTRMLKARIRNLLDAKNRLRKRFSEIGGVIPSSELTTNNIDEAFIDKATKIVFKNISDVDFKQEDLLKEMGIGRSQFYRKINSLTGSNPSSFIRTIRLRHASELLPTKGLSIKEVTHMTGFNSTAYFSKTFRELFGITPSEFIQKKGQVKDI